MRRIDRRRLMVAGASAFAMVACGAAKAAVLRLRPDRVLHAVPEDYAGFSVETAQLADPGFYHPDNRGLIALHRRLSRHGVLRLGGNSSDFCWWQQNSSEAAPHHPASGVGRRDNWMPQHLTAITPRAVEHLRGFLDACDWRCIYGLNLGTASASRVAEEAAFVARALGDRLLYFQIGNEPDFYSGPANRLRPPDWDFADYLNEWTAIADAVSAKVRDARFGGPDVGAARDWVARFAVAAPKRVGQRLVGLSGHYYASGPPDAPHVSIANLLAPNDAAARQMARILPAARTAGLGYRMTEGNSCYRGGKPGMSDAFAAALWGTDYMLAMAAQGCQGVHFHGGSGRQIAHSLGDRLPGAQTAADRARAAGGAFYSPFAGSRHAGFAARPLFYGMMLAERFAGATMIDCAFDSAGANATAYAATSRDGLLAAVINKDAARDMTLILDPVRKLRLTQVLRLTAPGLDATDGVRFAEADRARFDDPLRLIVPRASALLVRMR